MSSYDSSIGAVPLTTAPRYMADLRPAADTAATRTEIRPVSTLAVAAVGPPSPTQVGAVSKSAVLALRATEPATAAGSDRVERRLKPYGVVMLPHGPSEKRPEAKAAPDAGGTVVSDTRATTHALPSAEATRLLPQPNEPNDKGPPDSPVLQNDGDVLTVAGRIDPPEKTSPS